MNSVAVGRYRPADNPFASHRVEDLVYRSNGVSAGKLRPRLQELGGRAAIVGPKGSGKSTLLEYLASALPGEPILVRIKGSCRHPWITVRSQLPRPVTSNHLILVDGAEQLGLIGWRLLLRATRRAQNFVATLRRPGRLPILIECTPDLELLRELVVELTPAGAPTLMPHLEGLLQRHEGNIRSCFRELYDMYAGRRRVEF